MGNVVISSGGQVAAMLSTDIHGNMTMTGGDVEIAVADYAASTFVNLPDPTTVQAGVPYYVSDVGIGGSTWFSNGSRWLPVNGEVTIAQINGTIAAPIATLSATAAAIFAHPEIKFPAGMFVPGVSRVWVEGLFSRVGNAGTATVRFSVSTDTVPQVLEGINTASFSAVDLQTYRLATTFYPGDGTIVTDGWGGLNSFATSGAADKASAKFNTTLNQYMNFSIASANALDSFKLVAYRIVAFP